MMYMIPIRRAFAAGRSRWSSASTSFRKALTRLRPALVVASLDQSTARPSWCSETDDVQAAPTRPRPPPYFRTSQPLRYAAPGLAFGLHFSSGW